MKSKVYNSSGDLNDCNFLGVKGVHFILLSSTSSTGDGMMELLKAFTKGFTLLSTHYIVK